MKEIFFIELKKPSGIKSWYGTGGNEVFLRHGNLADSGDAKYGFPTADAAEAQRFAVERDCKNMGMMISSSKVISVSVRE